MRHAPRYATALLFALTLAGRADAACSYLPTDPALTGDAHYSQRAGCLTPYYSYFWSAFDFDMTDWNEGFGYEDACNDGLALARTMNGLYALQYSSDAPDYSNSNGYQGTPLDWAGVYAAHEIDELDARCSGGFGVVARTKFGPVVDNYTRLYMNFFNLTVAERAATIIHEAVHAGWTDHHGSACALGKDNCDKRWGDHGPFYYQVAWAGEFAYRANDVPAPVKQRLVDHINQVIDDSFDVHPGFYLQTADTPLLGDVDGDGRDELVVWRAHEGLWFAINPFTFKKTTDGLQFGGEEGDVPLVGDFDGDKRKDYAIWRPKTQSWHFISAAGNDLGWAHHGGYFDEPLVGDFNGDGTDDIAAWRPSDGTWRASTKAGATLFQTQFGQRADRPLVGDFDGDGKDDIFIWRPSTGEWHVIVTFSGGGATFVRQYGGPGDVPLLGHFDNDKRVDLAIWRPSTGEWHAITSSGAALFVRQYGGNGDVPLLGKMDANASDDLVLWRSTVGCWWSLGTGKGELFGNVPWGLPY